MASTGKDLGAFSGLRPTQARWVLAAWLGGSMLCVAITLSPYRVDFRDRPARPANDIHLYWAEVHRMWAGESYYEAAARELPARGYPTSSLFNWRTPLPMWLIARLPHPLLAKLLLAGASCLLLLGGAVLMRRDGDFLQAALGGVFLAGALLPNLLGDLYVMPMLWAATFLGLSMCAFAFHVPGMAVLFGFLAAVFRDLAAPYCGLMLVSAWWRRQKTECAAWALAIAAYSLFLCWHLVRISQLAVPSDAPSSHWIQFNGLPFLIGCAQMNGPLMLLPQWVAGLYLSSSLLGLASWNQDWGRRATLTAVAYCAVFLAVGQEINQYWGALIAPLWCFGIARAPVTLWRLWRSAFSFPSHPR